MHTVETHSKQYTLHWCGGVVMFHEKTFFIMCIGTSLVAMMALAIM